MPSEFSVKVIQSIRKVPKGKVATYGQIAALAGKPHAARGVSWILHSCSDSHKLPWHRILNSKGKISFPWTSRSFVRQKKLLVSEGVEFVDHESIDLELSQWQPRARRKLR